LAAACVAAGKHAVGAGAVVAVVPGEVAASIQSEIQLGDGIASNRMPVADRDQNELRQEPAWQTLDGRLLPTAVLVAPPLQALQGHRSNLAAVTNERGRVPAPQAVTAFGIVVVRRQLGDRFRPVHEHAAMVRRCAGAARYWICVTLRAPWRIAVPTQSEQVSTPPTVQEWALLWRLQASSFTADALRERNTKDVTSRYSPVPAA
jgi:hypothetical protein